MRPLRGMVIGLEGQALIIHLESGLQVTWPKVAGIRVNTSVWADYDHTEGELLRIYPAIKGECYEEPKNIEKPWPDEFPKDRSANMVTIDIYWWAKYSEVLGSGALCLEGDLWEYW